MARTADPVSSDQRLPPGTRIGAVVSTYHAELTRAMLASAQRELAAAGLNERDLLVVEVPGAFELPLVARELGIRDDVAAVLALGLVLKGETPHDRYIASAVADALQRVALELDKPVLFGLLTCDTLEQARARALPASEQPGSHDKGHEVARAAVAMLAALQAAKEVGRRRPRAGFFSSLGGGEQGGTTQP